MMQLLQLPSELLERILVQLHPMDVLLLRRVSNAPLPLISSFPNSPGLPKLHEHY